MGKEKKKKKKNPMLDMIEWLRIDWLWESKGKKKGHGIRDDDFVCVFLF